MAEVSDRTKADGEKVEGAEAATKDAQKPKKEKPKKEPKQKPQQQQAKKKNEDAALIGITVPKEEDLAGWYGEVLAKGEFLEYSDVPGCYIINPSSYAVWEYIVDFLNKKIKSIGVRNCYFPLFISEAHLQKEKDHLEGFEAEVAWVTHGGKEKLPSRLAIRPTSETAMYPYYAKKIRSHRDLPLRLNQWNNVVRWEFKHAMPFLRSREFLWQEGHTAHLTEAGASEEVRQVLDFYAAVYEELLAVPVVKGVKTENEKFAGAYYTTTIEGFVPSTGRGIQAGTSHCLGQHFSKMFGITVEDPSSTKESEKKDRLHVWQNSWGFTTRSIGVMVLVHSDNKGLVLPPRVAEVQCIIVTVGLTAKTSSEDRTRINKETEAIKTVLIEAGTRAEIDTREGYTPGYKFNEHELKGVPLRLEFGPKDSEKHQVTTSRRDQEGKGSVPITELNTAIPKLLEQIQSDMFNKAAAEYKEHRVLITNWDDFVPALNQKNVCLIPHCLGSACEDTIKDKSKRIAQTGDSPEDSRAPSMGAKSLCIPDAQPEGGVSEGTKCLNPECGEKAKTYVLFGRSY